VENGALALKADPDMNWGETNHEFSNVSGDYQIEWKMKMGAGAEEFDMAGLAVYLPAPIRINEIGIKDITEISVSVSVEGLCGIDIFGTDIETEERGYWFFNPGIASKWNGSVNWNQFSLDLSGPWILKVNDFVVERMIVDTAVSSETIACYVMIDNPNVKAYFDDIRISNKSPSSPSTPTPTRKPTPTHTPQSIPTPTPAVIADFEILEEHPKIAIPYIDFDDFETEFFTRVMTCTTNRPLTKFRVEVTVTHPEPDALFIALWTPWNAVNGGRKGSEKSE